MNDRQLDRDRQAFDRHRADLAAGRDRSLGHAWSSGRPARMTDAQLAARTPLGAHQVEFHPVAAVLGEPQVCMVCPDCGPIAYVAARDVEDAAAGHLKFATELDRVGDAA